MQITLMRHGKPITGKARWVAPVEMASWIEQYDRSLVEQQGVPAECITAAAAASVIVASTAPRALSSVHALGRHPGSGDAVFLEAELPYSFWNWPHLPPTVWAAVFRLCWLFGYSRGAESLHSTRARARAAAGQLASLAAQGPVLLVGHGIMNRLIGKELRASGWIARTKHGSRYWGTGVYEAPDAAPQ